MPTVAILNQESWRWRTVNATASPSGQTFASSEHNPFISVITFPNGQTAQIQQNSYGGGQPLVDNLWPGYNRLPPVATKTTVFSKLEFRSQCQLMELVGIDNYDQSQTLTAEQKAIVKTILKNFDLADYIDTTDARTIAGIQMLQQFGLISQDTATKILG